MLKINISIRAKHFSLVTFAIPPPFCFMLHASQMNSFTIITTNKYGTRDFSFVCYSLLVVVVYNINRILDSFKIESRKKTLAVRETTFPLGKRKREREISKQKASFVDYLSFFFLPYKAYGSTFFFWNPSCIRIAFIMKPQFKKTKKTK